jgi:ABC-type sugar transport system ATPase subunit
LPIKVEFSGIKKAYKNKIILSDFNLSIEDNEFVAILGKPGSGKSVILRILLGLEPCDEGKVFLRGKDVSLIPPGERGIGYIPQSFALFPNLSVYNNIAYPLTLAKKSGDEIKLKVDEIAKMLNITDLLNNKPEQLSGGEKQRVAIARGLVKENDIYVLDDPLVGLDFKLREQLQKDLRRLQEELSSTFIYSTSDSLEALVLADKIAVFSDMKCIESGTPEHIYREPENINTIRMVGFPEVNEISGKIHIKDGKVYFEAKNLSVKLESIPDISIVEGYDVIACIRPEHINLLEKENSKILTYTTNLILKEDLGGEEIINLKFHDLELRSVADHNLSDQITNKEIMINIDPLKIRVYSSEGGILLAKGVREHGSN